MITKLFHFILFVTLPVSALCGPSVETPSVAVEIRQVAASINALKQVPRDGDRDPTSSGCLRHSPRRAILLDSLADRLEWTDNSVRGLNGSPSLKRHLEHARDCRAILLRNTHGELNALRVSLDSCRMSMDGYDTSTLSSLVESVVGRIARDDSRPIVSSAPSDGRRTRPDMAFPFRAMGIIRSKLDGHAASPGMMADTLISETIQGEPFLVFTESLLRDSGVRKLARGNKAFRILLLEMASNNLALLSNASRALGELCQTDYSGEEWDVMVAARASLEAQRVRLRSLVDRFFQAPATASPAVPKHQRVSIPPGQ